jgi:hypothetical protein
MASFAPSMFSLLAHCSPTGNNSRSKEKIYGRPTPRAPHFAKGNILEHHVRFPEKRKYSRATKNSAKHYSFLLNNILSRFKLLMLLTFYGLIKKL